MTVAGPDGLNKPPRLRRQIVEAVLVNVFIAGAGLITGVLQSRALGPTGRGELAAIQLWAGIFCTFGPLGLYDAVIFHGSKSPTLLGQYAVTAACIIYVSAALLVSIGWVALPSLLHAQSSETIADARLYLLLVFSLATLSLSTSIARALQRTRLWNALRLLPTLIWLAVVSVGIGLGTPSPSGLAHTYLGILSVVSIVALFSVRLPLKNGFPPVRNHVRPLLMFGLPLAVSSLSLLANQRIDQVLLAGSLSAEQLGYYVVSLAFTGLALLPTVVVSLVAFPRIASLDSLQAQSALTAALVAKTGLTVTALAVFLGLSVERVLPLLFGPGFEPAVVASKLLLFGVPFRGVAQVLHGAAKGMGFPSLVLFSELAGLVLAGGSLFLLLPEYGLYGVAIATSLSSVVTCAVSLLLTIARVRSELPQDDSPTK